MNNKPFHAAYLFALAVACVPTWAQNVKVTPLGSHAGELRAMDRAAILEDRSGVRLLYVAGGSVTGAEAPRLGTVHVVLLTHAHGDDIGGGNLALQGAGTCEKPQTVT